MPSDELFRRLLSGDVSPEEIEANPDLVTLAMRIYGREALEDLGKDHRTALVLLTHDPKLDDPALEFALQSEYFYIGALGSKRTHAQRVERFQRKGFSQTDIARIHGPVGLDIGSATPSEIAISILAQMIQKLRLER